MTSLTAEAGSFFSRSVGCVTGQPGPQDVACGVFVGVGTVPTAATSEYRLGDAVLFGCVPAGFATVGGVPGINLNPIRVQRLPLWRAESRRTAPSPHRRYSNSTQS